MGDGLASAAELVEGERDEAAPLPTAEIAADLFARPRVGEGERPNPPMRRGPGRPPGARNRRTEQLAEYIRRTRKDPVAFLADVYSLPVDELATELGCKRLEALGVQVAAAKVVAEYVHQKQPQAVQIDGRGVVQLVLADPAAFMGGQNVDDDALVIEAAVEENQSLSGSETGEFNGREFNDAAETAENSGSAGAVPLIGNQRDGDGGGA